MNKLTFPWPEAQGVFESDGPAGHTLEVTRAKDHGLHTGRNRYRVVCKTCNEEVHEGTTGPRHWIVTHIEKQRTGS